jgi:hypothetical protein
MLTAAVQRHAEQHPGLRRAPGRKRPQLVERAGRCADRGADRGAVRQRERRLRVVASRSGVPGGELGACAGHQPVQPQHVDLVVGQAELVAARGADHDLRR